MVESLFLDLLKTSKTSLHCCVALVGGVTLGAESASVPGERNSVIDEFMTSSGCSGSS